MSSVGAGPARGTLRAAWHALLAAPDRVLLPTVVLSTLGIAGHVVLQHLIGTYVAGSSPCVRRYLGNALEIGCGPTPAREQLGTFVAMVAIYAVGHLVVAGMDRAALDLVDDVPPRGPFAGYRALPVLAVAVVLGTILAVATVFLVVPALVIAFATRYTLLFVLDQDLGPVAAVAASVRLVATDLAAEAGFAMLAFLALVAGVLALGVGAYVAVPVVLIAQAARYRCRVPRTELVDREAAPR
ncbi:MAG: hypothetical protein JWQ74_1994 [Marmoricola sp.]|nr:hypothetical protein [Marmoricola sp.]